MRYDDLVQQQVFQNESPAERARSTASFDQRLRRSLALADLEPQPLVVAAVREILSRLSTTDRGSFLEALSDDVEGTLRSVLVHYQLGGPLHRLVHAAIAQ